MDASEASEGVMEAVVDLVRRTRSLAAWSDDQEEVIARSERLLAAVKAGWGDYLANGDGDTLEQAKEECTACIVDVLSVILRLQTVQIPLLHPQQPNYNYYEHHLSEACNSLRRLISKGIDSNDLAATEAKLSQLLQNLQFDLDGATETSTDSNHTHILVQNSKTLLKALHDALMAISATRSGQTRTNLQAKQDQLRACLDEFQRQILKTEPKKPKPALAPKPSLSNAEKLKLIQQSSRNSSDRSPLPLDLKRRMDEIACKADLLQDDSKKLLTGAAPGQVGFVSLSKRKT